MKTFKTVYNMILEHAAKEKKGLNESENPMHMTVSGDGVWKKLALVSCLKFHWYSKKVIVKMVKSAGTLYNFHHERSPFSNEFWRLLNRWLNED